MLKCIKLARFVQCSQSANHKWCYKYNVVVISIRLIISLNYFISLPPKHNCLGRFIYINVLGDRIKCIHLVFILCFELSLNMLLGLDAISSAKRAKQLIEKTLHWAAAASAAAASAAAAALMWALQKWKKENYVELLIIGKMLSFFSAFRWMQFLQLKFNGKVQRTRC